MGRQFSIPVLWSLHSKSVREQNYETQLRTPTLAVRVQLSLGWNTYLLFSTDIVNFVWKTNEGEAECIVLLIFVLWRCLNCRWMRVGGRKFYLGRAEIGSFSSRDFSRRNKHDTFWHVVSTGYFCVLFLWTIAVSDFRPLEIYKKLDLHLSTITFTVNSHTDNHFYKYLFVSNIIQCEFSLFIKIHVQVLTKVFYIQIWIKCETPLVYFRLQKKLFIEKNSFLAVDCVKII